MGHFPVHATVTFDRPFFLFIYDALNKVTLVVRLTLRSSSSRPSSSAQYSTVWLHWFFMVQPPGRGEGKP